MTGTVIHESLYGTTIEYANGSRAFYPRSWFGQLIWRWLRRRS